ncbi:uncharacterized protein BYT42DRAFT_595148 [Radiomyces spectabilis]|uniref:uncharacterized protein n=1 Tax=Radiomyces spectabilis TaxID=64574 RepID=UPI00221E85E7|nr:uncharacterized protein BYT42DRAFT_595148 [Radiomyces spectabilis]KAI8371750.1 hypothetical protein BYT42DRAFT_595148 [Radiomyces spectabilis]
MNKPAIQCGSLYHTCRSVLDKLAAVEGMTEYLEADSLPTMQQGSPSISSVSSSEPSTPTLTSGDPLSKLWTICRQGSSLCTLYNALQPNQPLSVNSDPNLNQINTCKASVYHFIVACRNELKFPEEDMFTISDLYQDDTNGFVKVVNTISKILQLLEDRGVISVRSSNRNSDPNAPKNMRDQVVLELLSTERKYVEDMQTLQNYMRELQAQKIVSPDTIHYLFGNLNALMDFQRRFLIQMEDIAEKPAEEQRFGHLFVQMEEAFAVYEPYCSNYYSAQDLVVQETPKLQQLANILNPTYELPSLLIKPIQRICKYPLLQSQLIKSTNCDWPYYAEMEEGLEAIKRVAGKVNETQRQHENIQAVEELKKRVDNWKGHTIEGYGNLLVQDKLLMSSNDSERELHVFLFEKALLICKESKDSSRNRLTKNNTLSMKKKRRGSLQPKAMILTSRILTVHNKSNNGMWVLQVEFRDREIEQFTLKFRNEEKLKLWETTLNKIKSHNKSNVPNTHLTSMSLPGTPTQSVMNRDEGYYLEEDDDDEEDDYYDDEEDDYYQARANGNGVLPLNRPRVGSTQYDPSWKSGSISSQGGRPFHNMPGMNLSPLPRSSSSVSTSASSSPPINYGAYPASPPPSNPSSPTTSRVSTGNSSPVWPRREDGSFPLANIASKFMNGGDLSDDHRQHPLPIGRSHSQSAAATGPGGIPLGAYPQPPLPASQTRLRSQSSPNIHKNSHGHWDELPQIPISSRTLYQHADTGSPGLSPRLADAATSQSLQSQIDRVVNAVPSSPGTVKVKLSYNDGIYVIVIPQEVTFYELMEKVEKKIRFVANLRSDDILRLKYQDEDGDFITINSDEDVQMAFESRGVNNTVNLFVCL